MENIIKGMNIMTDEQIRFFGELRKIQDSMINITLCQEKKYHTTEEMLIDISYDIIYRCMELIDGYRNDNIKYLLKNIQSGEVVNENIDLHNYCEEYLKI